MIDKEEGMLDMSPGALYPTNRAVSVEQRWGKCPKWLPQCDEVQEEDHDGVDERRINMILHDFQITHKPTLPARTLLWDCESQRLDVIFRATSLPDCMRKCGWRHVVLLRLVSSSLKGWVESGEDSFKTLAQCLADDAGLYMPHEAPGNNWKGYFFNHLYPARHKWNQETERISDHKIRVAVRFKRLEGLQRDRQLVLPLHQRLKMLKKGEKITVEEAAGQKGLSVDELKAQLVKDGGELDADILEMLQDAQNLQHAANRAQTDADNHDYKHLSSWDSGGADGGGDCAEDKKTGNMGIAAGSSGTLGEGSVRGDRVQSSQTTFQIEDESEFSRRRSGGSRVLSVDRFKVVTFVPGVGVRPFNFSNVFDKDASQETVYTNFAQNAVLCALNGFNACVLAYGQTGSGKTFSLFGPPGWLEEFQGSGMLRACHGIVVRSVCGLLEASARMKEASVAHISVTAQYVQVYKEVVTCLATGDKVTLRASGGSGSFVAAGATESQMDTPRHLLDLLERGESYKRYGATAMNDRSSRAHTVLILNLTHVRPSPSEGTSRHLGDGGGEMVKSQLLLADLAGCEHISKSKAHGDAKREAATINSGLLVLKKCISALNQEKSHVPYLESKVTMLLKGALGGSSRTFCLVTGSLDEVHGDETIEAMRFGEQCAGVTNQTRTQASSLRSAVAAIDRALAVCQHGIDSLSARGKSDLAAFKALQTKHAALSRKRADLAGKEQPQVSSSKTPSTPA